MPTCINNSDKKNLGHCKDLPPGAKRKEETGIPLGREKGYTHPPPPGRTNRVEESWEDDRLTKTFFTELAAITTSVCCLVPAHRKKAKPGGGGTLEHLARFRS